MNFDLLLPTGQGPVLNFDPEVVIVAGFTGRDEEKVHAHLEELAKLGIAPPDRVPTFYLVPPQSLMQTESITTVHHNTSGEAEIALLVQRQDMYVTLASDHTDRAAEVLDIGLSKLACPKIVATAVWRLADIASDWDSLWLQSWIEEDGQRQLYQTGAAGMLLGPHALLEKIPFRQRPDCFVVLLGTLPVIGEIKGSTHFWAELRHPTGQRNLSLRLDYGIQHLEHIFASDER